MGQAASPIARRLSESRSWWAGTCAREQEALHHVAAGHLEESCWSAVSTLFGGDLQPQSLDQRDNCGNDRAGIGTMAQALDENCDRS
jgi:hypothetical protein